MDFHPISIVYELDRSEEYHIARLLLLLRAMQDYHPEGVEGLTKLAKLDFFLRYPTLLRKALLATGRKRVPEVEAHEELSVESSMVRFKYGPWDHRYKQLLLEMRSRRVVVLTAGSRAVFIHLEPGGDVLAQALVNSEVWSKVFERARLVASVFGDYKGTRLKDFVYKTFPELRTMRMNEEINTYVY